MPDFSAQLKDSSDQERELMAQLIPILERTGSATLMTVVLARLLGAAVGGFYKPERHDEVAEGMFDIARRSMRMAQEAVPSILTALHLLRSRGVSEERIAEIFRGQGSHHG